MTEYPFDECESAPFKLECRGENSAAIFPLGSREAALERYQGSKVTQGFDRGIEPPIIAQNDRTIKSVGTSVGSAIVTDGESSIDLL